MRIDKKLNLVIPVERDDGTTAYVHAIPVSAEVFDKFFLEISRTFAGIIATGLGEIAGPRVAAKVLRKTSQDLGTWREVESGLVADMRRTSSVLVPKGTGGWDFITLQEALDRDLFSAEDVSEVENAITFFTVYSAIQRRRDLAETLDGLAGLWGAQITSLSATEYAASLRTSTKVDATGTGMDQKQSLIPS